MLLWSEFGLETISKTNPGVIAAVLATTIAGFLFALDNAKKAWNN